MTPLGWVHTLTPAPLLGRLGALPQALVRLTALRELRIAAGSTLERLPAFLGRLASLERLHLSVGIEGRRAAPAQAPLSCAWCRWSACTSMLALHTGPS